MYGAINIGPDINHCSFLFPEIRSVSERADRIVSDTNSMETN